MHKLGPWARKALELVLTHGGCHEFPVCAGVSGPVHLLPGQGGALAGLSAHHTPPIEPVALEECCWAAAHLAISRTQMSRPGPPQPHVPDGSTSLLWDICSH